MVRFPALALLAILMLCSPGTADVALAQQPSYETTEITDGVYMFRYQAHNAMFVATGDGVIAFDPISPEAARIYREEIARVTSEPVIAIVYSHQDADHISGGNELAEGVHIIAHANARKFLGANPNPDIPLPNHVFTKDMSMWIGDTELRLVYLGRNHSDNSIVAHLPGKGIVFAVDFVANNRVAYRDLPGFYLPDLWESLERMQQLDYHTAIFGHGPPGSKADVYAQMNYWNDLRRWAEAAVAGGLSEDEAVDDAELPAYRDWGGYDNWFKMNARTVYSYYADLSGRM